MFVLNGITLDKEYTMEDVKEYVPIEFRKDIPEGFFGGNVTHIGKTDNHILLLLNNRQGWSILGTATENLEELSMKQLREMLKQRLIPVDVKLTKEETIRRLV